MSTCIRLVMVAILCLPVCGKEQTLPKVTPADISKLKPADFSDQEADWGYSPYAFLNRKHEHWFPTESQRDAAIAMLPCMAKERFIHQRVDSRKPVQFTYIRRPGYYSAFNSGEIITPRQRYGIGLTYSIQFGSK